MSRGKIIEVYKFFCIAQGNQHIASEFAILKIQELINKFKARSVLEIGLGIGAMAESLLSANKNLQYSGTENNSFCINALKNNLTDNYARLEIFLELRDIPERKFDLIIIDGKDEGLTNIQKLINPRSIIVIEGDRYLQQKSILQYFPAHKYVHSISIKKNRDYGPFPADHWQGGLKIIFVNPNFKQNLWWGRERIKTKLKYYFRK